MRLRCWCIISPTLLCDNRRYLYLVNREYYPVTVELNLKNKTGKATDLSSGQSVVAKDRWILTLSPYQLCSFSLSPEAEIQNFQTAVPNEIAEPLNGKWQTALKQIERLKKNSISLPAGTEKMVQRLRDAQEKKQYALIRRGLDSYIMRKCDELAAKIESK